MVDDKRNIDAVYVVKETKRESDVNDDYYNVLRLKYKTFSEFEFEIDYHYLMEFVFDTWRFKKDGKRSEGFKKTASSKLMEYLRDKYGNKIASHGCYQQVCYIETISCSFI